MCPWLRRRLRVSAILFPTLTVGSLGRGRYWSLGADIGHWGVKKILTTHPLPLLERSLEPKQLDDAPKILCTPYIMGLSEKIEKVCAPLGVKPVFRLKRTLKRELMQVKNRTPEQKQTEVVYEIPCKDCPEVYMGETKRTLKVRLSEHRQAVKQGDPKYSGIVVHVQKTNHRINWEAPQSKDGPRGSG